MSVTEVLSSLGSWDLHLKESTPDEVIAQLGYFGHVAIVDGPVDVAAAGNGLLAGARYVGVCREQDHADDYVRGGSGLVFWLGDEDGKGPVILTEISLTNATLAQVVTALKPATVTTGTVYAQADPAVRYTGKHVFQTRREALATALAPFGAEIRVNPDFSIDVGTPSQLYATATPDTIIIRKAVGADLDLAAIGGDFETAGSAVDYSTDVTLLGQTVGTGGAPDTVFATGSAAAPSVPYKDPQGNQLKITRLISESGETTGSVASRAQLQINRFNRTTSSVKVTAEDFEIQGSFNVGDATYVFDPDTGIVNSALEVFFRGEKLNPDIVRVTGRTWPIVEGMTVAWRTDAGVWLDLTPWVVWETAGQHELTVGDLPKTLLRSGQPNAPVQDRVDASRGNPDTTRVPKAPTGLTLATSSAANATGWDSAVITATWNPVTQYTDNTTVALDRYEVQYRPQFRAPAWASSTVTTDVTADLPVTAALAYDVQVRAVSTGGVASAWSSTSSITSAADTSGPATPSDPVVTPYLGLLRIYWNGLTSTGTAMPADFNRIDVHVGTTAGFTASAATLVSSLSAAGYAHTQAPYGTARYARFIAYDHNGNASSASATVAGTAVQAADGDIAAMSVGKLTAGTMTADVITSGRFTTALTGARREVNAVGFQAFDASNNLLINLDGVNNLLTGVFQTGLPGVRRIKVSAVGFQGQIDFIAPDGTQSRIAGFTGTVGDPGTEGIRMGIIPASSTIWQGWGSIQAEGTGVDQSEIHAWTAYHQVVVGGNGPETNKGWEVMYASDRGTASTNPTRIGRVGVDNNDFWVRDDTGTGRNRIVVNGSGAANGFNYYYSSQHIFYNVGLANPNQGGYMQILPGFSGGGNGNSPTIQLTTVPIGGSQYAGRFKFAVGDPSLATPGFQFRNTNDTGFTDAYANNFISSSSEKGKEKFRPMVGSAMDKLRPVQGEHFTRKPKAGGRHAFLGPDGAEESVALINAEPIEEFGFRAESLPAEVVVPEVAPGEGPGFSHAAMLAMLVNAVNEVDARLASIEKKGKAA